MDPFGRRDLLGPSHGVDDGATMGVGSRSEVARAAFERRDLRVSKPLTTLDELVEDRPRPPVHLVDGPRNGRRLGELTDALSIGAGERFSQCGSRSDEVSERRAVEVVDSRVESHSRASQGCETAIVKFSATVKKPTSKRKTQ